MKRTRTWIVLGAVAILAVPFFTSSSLASWTDQEWAHATPVSTESLDCGLTTGFTTAASGRQVSGALLGTDLDAAVAVRGVSNAVDGVLNETYTPTPGAHDLDPASTTTFTRATSLNVGALPPLVGVYLPTVDIPTPPSLAVGTLAQYSQVRPTGVAVGATGAVTDQSGIATIGEYGASTPPDNGSISLKDVLGSAITSNLTDVSLDIGAVSALSRVDGCDILREATWDIPAQPTSVTRDYDIAKLALTLDSPLLAGLVPQIESSIATLQGQLNGLQSSLGTTLSSALGNINLLGIVSLGGTTISVTAIPNLSTVASGLLDSFTDGVVTLSPRTGQISVDLEALLGGPDGLNGLDPNTVLTDPQVLSSLGVRVNGVLNAWQQRVIDTITAATNAVRVKVEVALTVTVIVKIADVKLTLDADLGAIGAAPNTPTSLVQISATLLGAPVTLTGTASTLVNTIAGALFSTVRAAVGSILSTITTLNQTIQATITPLSVLVSGVFTALSPLLRIHVNVQPDRPGAPSPGDYIPATESSTAQYIVTALQIDLLTPAPSTSVKLATASAGPVLLPDTD